MKRILLLLLFLNLINFVILAEDPPPHVHDWQSLATWIGSYNTSGHEVWSGWQGCTDCKALKPGSGTTTRRNHTLGSSTISSHNETQHKLVQECTATGYKSSCGYTKTTYQNHSKAWVGTTYKCTDNCGWVDTANSAKAAAVESAYNGIKGQANAAKGDASAVITKGNESYNQFTYGDDDWKIAEDEELIADKEEGYADNELTDAVAGKKTVKDFNKAISAEETANRNKAEMKAQASYCSICGEKLIAGNPVNVVSGAKIEYFSDLEINGPGDHIHVERYYNNQNTDALSFGQGFHFNYDSRIIFGVKIRAQEAYDLAVKEYNDAIQNLFIANIHISKAVTAFGKAITSYGEASIHYRDAKIALEEALGLLETARITVAAADQAFKDAASLERPNGVPSCSDMEAAISAASEAVGDALEELGLAETAYGDALGAFGSAKGNQISAENAAVRVEAELNTFETVTAPAIREAIQDVIDYLFIVKKRMKEELDVANAQKARNKYVLDPLHIDKQLFGNGYVIWIDENGVERIFQSISAVDPYSSATLTNGEMNVWPAGSIFTSLYGRNWTMSMDSSGNITVSSEDTEKQFSYNEYGRLTQIKDRDGNFVNVNFNGRKITKATDKFGRTATFVTNSDGRITTITDFSGRSVSYTYSDRLLSSYADLENNTYTYGYDYNGNLNYIENPDNTSRRYVYALVDEDYKVVEEYDELNNGQYFDYFNVETVHTNREEGKTYYTINDYHIEKIEYPDGRVEEDLHNNSGDRTSHINSAHDQHTFTPDADGNIGYEKLITGAEVNRTFHSIFNLPESEIIETDNWKTENKIEYYESGNGKGRVSKITYTNPESGILDPAIYTEYRYDSYGRLIWKRDKDGQATDYNYNDLYPLEDSTLEIIKNGVSTVLTLDELGRVISQSRGDMKSEYKLDALGRVLLQTQLGENVNIKTQYNYNYHGLDNKIGPFTDADSSTIYTEYKYNERTNLTNILITERSFTLDSDGATISSFYDEDLIQETIIKYDREENPTYQKRPDGTMSYLEYDRAGKLKSTGYYRYADKIELKSFRYDFAGRIEAVIEDGHEQVRYEYPDSRHINEYRYGGELRIYKTLDQLGRIEKISSESADGYKEIEYHYDYLGRVDEVTTNRDGDVGTEYYDYDLLGRLVYQKGLRGEEVNIFTDDVLRKTSSTGPEGLTSEVIYDIYGNVTESSESGKGTTTYGYNLFGKTVNIELPEGGGYSYQYDTLGRPVEVTDRKGETTSITYGPMGSYKEILNPKDELTRIEYDIAGRVTAEINPLGATSRYEYAPFTGAIAAVIGAENEMTVYEYDDLGYLISVTEIGENDERVKEYKHDRYGRLTDLYGEEGYHIAYEYDYNGNLRKMFQGPENYQKVLREWEYSVDGLLEAEIYTLDGRDFRHEYEYDLSGLLKKEINYRNQVIDYKYDDLGRTDLINYPDGEFYDWSYSFTNTGSTFQVDGVDGYSHAYGLDKEGKILFDEDLMTRDKVDYRYNSAQELQKILGPKQSMSLTYSYDELGRMTNVTSGGAEQVDFTYDQSGNMIRADYGSSEKSLSDYFYDLSGRMTGYRTIKNWGSHEELLDGYIYEYDQYSDVIYQADKDGLVTRYEYDGLDRLHQVWYPSQKGEKNRAAVKERKDLGLTPNEDTEPEYLTALTDIGNIESSFLENYESVFGEFGNRTEPFLNGQFHNERIDYDIFGRRSEKANEYGSIRYGYNKMDQLIRAGNRAYEYDLDGNRTSEFFTDQAWLTDESGLNVSLEQNDLNIGGNGNGLALGQLGTNGSNPHSNLQEAWSNFEYRADNRMTRYTDSQGEDWAYKYDGFGRRYEKERFGSAHPTKDVWRNDEIWYAGLSHNILAEYTEIETWNDKTIQSGLEYLVGPGGRAYGAHENYNRNGHEWSPNSWKNRRYYHYDRLGSVTAISLDKPGLSGPTYQYGPFGDVLDGEHSWGWDYNGDYHMGFDSVGFTGYRIDAESGLYHAPFREYDPLVANWTTSDPIKDGTLWYGYVNNNPVRFVDPLGLEHCNPNKVPVVDSMHWGRFDLPGIPSFNSTGNIALDYTFSGGASLINGIVSGLSLINNATGPFIEMGLIGFGAGINAVDEVAWDYLNIGLDEIGITLYSNGIMPGMIFEAMSYYGKWGKASLVSRFFKSPIDDISVFKRTPFQVHINPNTGIGPMAIDTSAFSSGAKTLNGGIRNSRKFWSNWADEFGSTLSNSNLALIDNGLSPVVDDIWIKTFPEFTDYLGKTLIHHHLDYGKLAIPLPSPVHALQPGWSIWHQ